jgi:hypothetical protein
LLFLLFLLFFLFFLFLLFFFLDFFFFFIWGEAGWAMSTLNNKNFSKYMLRYRLMDLVRLSIHFKLSSYFSHLHLHCCGSRTVRIRNKLL